MNTSEKQQLPYRRPQTAQAAAPRSWETDSLIPAPPAPKSDFPEKPSYLKYAFANPYNLALLGGALAASVLTLNPLIGIAALGLEGLWLLHGSQSKLMQRKVWDPLHEQARFEHENQRRLERIHGLPEHPQRRALELLEREKQIKQLAENNPTFTGELLRGELTKTSRLVDAFIDLSVNCSRYEDYLLSLDTRQLERDRAQWESYVKANDDKAGQTEVQLARKNLELIYKRIERVKEIQRYIKIAYGQMSLIENSFKFIADQIVTMQSPSELSGQLDELLDGVEGVKQTAQETEQILRAL
jgi:hypothetical protein